MCSWPPTMDPTNRPGAVEAAETLLEREDFASFVGHVRALFFPAGHQELNHEYNCSGVRRSSTFENEIEERLSHVRESSAVREYSHQKKLRRNHTVGSAAAAGLVRPALPQPPPLTALQERRSTAPAKPTESWTVQKREERSMMV